MLTEALLLMSAAVQAPNVPPAPAPAPLACHMTIRADAKGHWLRFELRNTSATAVWLLTWGSPFEGAWLNPFVTVHQGDTALPYQGGRAKRGDPEKAEYLRWAAHQTRTVTVRLEDAYALSGSGPWRIQAQWRWHDVIQGSTERPPRPRDRHQGQDQTCGSLVVP